MSQYMTLLGSEQVQSAANSMRNAAEEMNRAANTIDTALQQHRIFMDEWLSRLESVLKEAAP